MRDQPGHLNLNKGSHMGTILSYVNSAETLSNLLSKSAKLDLSVSESKDSAPEKFFRWLMAYHYIKTQKEFIPEVIVQSVQKLHEYAQYTPEEFVNNLEAINQMVDGLIQYNFLASSFTHNISNITSDHADSIENISTKSSTQEIFGKIGTKDKSSDYLEESKVAAGLAVYDQVEKRNLNTQKALPPVTVPPLQKVPAIIFGEIHTDVTTDNLIQKLAKKLKEKGYERYYIEAPQGLVPSDLPKENSTMMEMKHHGLEVRAIDVAALEEEEKQNFTKHFLDQNSALAKARNSTMAWHYAHAEVPVVGVMGLNHLSEVQKKLIAYRPDTANLENHYLCIYAHSREPALEVEKEIARGAVLKDYPLGVLEINTSQPDGEDKAVELILKKIDEKIQAIEQGNVPSSRKTR